MFGNESSPACLMAGTDAGAVVYSELGKATRTETIHF